MPRLDHLMRSVFDVSTLKRGRAYAANDQVVQAKVRDGRLLAVVEGQDSYEVAIDLQGLHLGDDHIAVDALECECSCPISRQCKHAVAALIVWAESQDVDLELHPPTTEPASERPAPSVTTSPLAHLVTRPWQGDQEQQHWLQQLHALVPPAQDATRLLYVLDVEKDGPPRLVLVLSRRLKNGRPGVGKRYPSLEAFLRNPPASVPAEDRALIAAAQGEGRLGQSWWDDRIHSGALLERLAATGRLVWGDVAGIPVRLLPPREVMVVWRQREDARRVRLRLALADAQGAEVTTLAVSPPWYRSGDGIGPLLSGLGDAWLTRLAAMPWLDPAVAAASMASLPPGIPPPPLQAAHAPPRPWLRIERVALKFWSRGPGEHLVEADVVVAGFAYGDDEVAEGGHALMTRSDGSALVRDVPAEQARIAELQRLGLVRWPPPGLMSYGGSPGGLANVPLRTVAGIGKAEGPSPAFIPPAVLAALVGSGWDIRGTAAPAVAVHDLTGIAARVDDHQDGDWFELHLGIDVAGRRIDLVPLLTPLLRGGPVEWQRLPRAGGEPPAVLAACGDEVLVRVPLDLLADLHARLVELFDAPAGPGGGWRIDPMRGDLLDALDRLSPRWIGAERLRTLATRLRSCLEPPTVAPPAELAATLRPYQLQGLGWLRRLRELGIGGILADDMGLGKTVQAIAHLLLEHACPDCDRASLVVCPASVVGVWRAELARFAPTLPATVLHGAGRQRVDAGGRGVMITSYATLARDVETFAAVRWQVVIADEAQAFKNTGTAINAAMRRLEARQHLCLTGTPVENHLGELHALLGWAAPGVLGGGNAFARAFRSPIEDGGDRGRADLLRRRTAPFLLRRTKAAVAADLPARCDIDLPVDLGPAQRRLYEAIRLAMDARVREAVADRGLARSGLTVLEALLRLRQACCDPRLLPERLGDGVEASAKLEALAELLATLVEERRQVLVFSQFTGLLDLVEEHVLRPAGIPWLRLDGQSRQRAELVRRFQDGEAPVFLLSLKAGGTGLTLTAADTVVLLDPWWNPAVERQAADRAHRIGQQRPVTIYRLVVGNSVESRIRALQANKTALADALLDETGQALGRLSLADIESLMAPVDTHG
jgi:superfamily II DNA or RNA helicase